MPPPPRSLAVFSFAVAAVLLLVAAKPAAQGHGVVGGMACSAAGTVGECADDDDGAAAIRRELGGSGNIGYGAMNAGNVPCSYRGASYYNCRPSGAANPYSRGCSAITQCRG